MVLVKGLHEGFQLFLLGGSWVVISGVISRVTILITHIRGLISPLITTHEPPSMTSRPGGPLKQVSLFGERVGESGPAREPETWLRDSHLNKGPLIGPQGPSPLVPST